MMSRTWMGIMLGMLLWAQIPGRSEEPAREPVKTAVVLRQALKEKRVVVFIYHGHQRKVEPHALGTGAEGRPALLAWQTEGGSQTEPPPGWRTFLLAEIKEMKPTETTFSKARSDYQRGGKGLKTVEAEVAAE